MTVHVYFFSSLRAAARTQSVDIDAKNVAKALRKLKMLFENNEEFHKLLKISNAILNGRNVLFIRGSRTKLVDGDKLAFFTPLGGG